MKNRMLIFVAVVCVAILLTACSNNNDSNDTARNDNTATTDENSELDTETIAKTLSSSAPAALKNTYNDTYNAEGVQDNASIANIASDNAPTHTQSSLQ